MDKSRRTAIEILILATLAAAIAILVLNHLEVDEYPDGLGSIPVDRDLPSWLSTTLDHPCETCKACPHKFETAESRLAVTVTDRDGWYRLSWAGSESYAYDDAALVGAALRNRTAELKDGTWTIRGRYLPAERHETHSCTPAAGEVDLRYRLHRGMFPGPGDPAIDPSGTLAVPRRLLWFRYPFPPDCLDDFWWELENPETFAGTKPLPCTCASKD